MKQYKSIFKEVEKIDAYLAIEPIKKAAGILDKKQKEWDDLQKKADKLKKDPNKKSEFNKILQDQLKVENDISDVVETLTNIPVIKKLAK